MSIPDHMIKYCKKYLLTDHKLCRVVNILSTDYTQTKKILCHSMFTFTARSESGMEQLVSKKRFKLYNIKYRPSLAYFIVSFTENEHTMGWSWTYNHLFTFHFRI